MERKLIYQFQFVEQNSVECWCDLGANLVQHFIGRYSRYSRYRTKSHDKATISHDISRYSRYQTVFLKLEEIISYLIYKKLCFGRAFCQSVEKRPSRESDGGRFCVFEAKKGKKSKEIEGMVISPFSFSEFFEIHGSKFKPYPI